MTAKNSQMKDENEEMLSSSSNASWILASLEHDQLVRAKKHSIPRRILRGPQLLLLWALRIYLLFMMIVVLYQAWIGTR